MTEDTQNRTNKSSGNSSGYNIHNSDENDHGVAASKSSEKPQKTSKTSTVFGAWKLIRPFLIVLMMIMIVGYGSKLLAEYFGVADRFDWVADMLSLVAVIGGIIVLAGILMLGLLKIKQILFPRKKSPWEE